MVMMTPIPFNAMVVTTVADYFLLSWHQVAFHYSSPLYSEVTVLQSHQNCYEEKGRRATCRLKVYLILQLPLRAFLTSYQEKSKSSTLWLNSLCHRKMLTMLAVSVSSQSFMDWDRHTHSAFLEEQCLRVVDYNGIDYLL